MADLFTLLLGILYPLLVGIGWVLMSLAYFKLAKGFFSSTMVIAVGGSIGWEVSTEVTTVRIIVASILAAVFVALSGWFVAFTQVHEDAKLLKPGTLPSPSVSVPGGLPNDALVVYCGNCFGALGPGNHQVILRIEGKDVLTMDRDEKGRLTISGDVYDDRQNLVARIERNRWIPTNYAAYTESKDESSLKVVDHAGGTVFEVAYLNPRALQVLGTFRSPGQPPVYFRPEGVFLGDRLWMSGSGGIGVGVVMNIDAHPVPQPHSNRPAKPPVPKSKSHEK